MLAVKREVVEMETKRILWVSRGNPPPEKEAEWNEWYNTVHIPELLQVPGFLSATRYECIRGRKTNPKYLTIYEIESEEILETAINGPEALAVRDDSRRRWGEPRPGSLRGAFKPIFGLPNINIST